MEERISRSERVSFSCLGMAWVCLVCAQPATGQSFNLDFGQPDDGPPPTYAAAGRAGHWHSLPASHGTTTPDLVDIHGQVTGVSLLQIGGLETVSGVDPATEGDDALLLDDYLVTFDEGLESCIFLDGMQPGLYEVLIYARIPDDTVLSYTSVDQEPGLPHLEVGGVWTGDHEELISYSRHVAIVGDDGNLDLHSGIAPEMQEEDGAALNGMQVLRVDIFRDGFESGDTSAWDG